MHWGSPSSSCQIWLSFQAPKKGPKAKPQILFFQISLRLFQMLLSLHIRLKNNFPLDMKAIGSKIDRP